MIKERLHGDTISGRILSVAWAASFAQTRRLKQRGHAEQAGHGVASFKL